MRPLLDTGKGDTAELSREHEITVSDGLVTMAGGKLTVSRSMAEHAVDEVCGLLGLRRRCRTTRAAIIGGGGSTPRPCKATGGTFGHLSGRYGAEARFVEDIALGDGLARQQPMPVLHYLWAEPVLAIRHEMASTVSDILTRRIPARFLDSSQAAAAAPRVGDLLTRELGLSAAEASRQVAEFVAEVDRKRTEPLRP